MPNLLDCPRYRQLILLISIFHVIGTGMWPDSLYADDVRFGLGTGILYGETDFIVSYHPDGSHWVYGFRRGYDEFTDESIGFDTRDETTVYGPMVYYLLQPESAGSFYGCAGLFVISFEHISIETNETDRDTSRALFLGGGYTRRIRENMFFDLGASFNMGRELHTETSVSSVDTTGLEARIILGLELDD